MSKNSKGEEKRLFVCDCGDMSHQFIVSWYPEDKDWNDLIYFTVHLNQSYNFWKRLWHGIKYIFGFKCRFGAFDEILLDVAEAKHLRDTLDQFISEKRNTNGQEATRLPEA